MSDIILSSAVRSNLTSLQQTADLIAQTQTRLSTGKKVNSALDNPLNFFTSQSLSSRANDLNSLLDSVSNAVQTLNAASNGITSLTKLVQSAQAIAQQAQQSAATTGKYTGTVSGLSGTTTGTFTAANTITVTDGAVTATFAAAGTSADTVQAFIDQVNNTAGLKVKAELSSDGKVLLEATGTNTIAIAGTATVGEKAQFGLVAGTTAAGTLNATRTSLATQYDALRTQIDQLAGDSGYNGVNLLNGDGLKVVFNEKGTSSQSITGVKFSSTGLGITASTNSLQTDKDLTDALANLSTALNTLRSQASAFGSSLSVVQTRHDFTKAMIDTLQSGSDKLVLADTNAEGANLLALQTRQSLSTTSLSLAAQSDRNVLKLFGG
jgi:flagellin-like hook-associated protein FlgL